MKPTTHDARSQISMQTVLGLFGPVLSHVGPVFSRFVPVLTRVVSILGGSEPNGWAHFLCQSSPGHS